jgi:ketosteroid isomerase-like protein
MSIQGRPHDPPAAPESGSGLHPFNGGTAMSTSTAISTPTAIAQEAYQAFGRFDVPALLNLMADNVDWEFVGSPTLSYAGKRRDKQAVADFFAAVAKADDIHVFEPREFIEGGEHVTVLGWERSTAIDTGHEFESDWVHVFTVKDGKVTRWRGFFNTAARYGK